MSSILFSRDNCKILKITVEHAIKIDREWMVSRRSYLAHQKTEVVLLFERHKLTHMNTESNKVS